MVSSEVKTWEMARNNGKQDTTNEKLSQMMGNGQKPGTVYNGPETVGANLK